jgi:geranylgeranyl pyrophosphate synthase
MPDSAVADRALSDQPLDHVVATELQNRWAAEASLLGSMCHYALVPTGKLFRPVLLLESALAVGGELSSVLPAAVGAECGHVASLIHDDIIDGDDLRRGRASVQHKFGVGDAIVAGDALIFDMFAGLAQCRLTGVPEPRVVLALDAVARAGLDLCRGQSLEAELCRGLLFDADAYLRMARLKTASFFRGACESGAILGGGPPEWVEALASYGDSLGTAFQIYDDLLAYTSNTETMGKPDTSDVENGRLTLPVILAYQLCGPTDRQRIMYCLESASDPVEALTILSGLLEQTGALAEATKAARDHAQHARDVLTSLPPTPSRDRLMYYAELVVSRNH